MVGDIAGSLRDESPPTGFRGRALVEGLGKSPQKLKQLVTELNAIATSEIKTT